MRLKFVVIYTKPSVNLPMCAAHVELYMSFIAAANSYWTNLKLLVYELSSSSIPTAGILGRSRSVAGPSPAARKLPIHLAAHRALHNCGCSNELLSFFCFRGGKQLPFSHNDSHRPFSPSLSPFLFTCILFSWGQPSSLPSILLEPLRGRPG